MAAGSLPRLGVDTLVGGSLGPTWDKLCLESSLPGDWVVTQGRPGMTALWDEKPSGCLRSAFYSHSARRLQILGFVWGRLGATTPILQMSTLRLSRCKAELLYW